jgi:serine/threonine-protein kinase
MIGSTVGKYRIVGQVGRGGAGTVYKAVDETLNRDVAIKTLNPDLANTEVMARFRAEATILAKLNHPHIATIYELFHAESDLLMVMEFVPGETLDQLSARLGPMSPGHACTIVDQILSALEHAHRAGIVHRDMKPANVMVTAAGDVKIMDFGIARVRGADQMTVDGRLMGTPAYMPPEQALAEHVDGRADLYSVGVLFYRLLTAALPFTADSTVGMLQRQIRETPTPLHVHRPGLPGWCDAVVERALAKAPSDRFQTAEEFREALSRGVRSPLAAGDTIDLSPPASESNRTLRRRAPRTYARYAWAAMAAIIASGAAAFGYASATRDPTVSAVDAMLPPRPVLESGPAAAPVTARETALPAASRVAAPEVPVAPEELAPAPRVAPLPSTAPPASQSPTRRTTSRRRTEERASAPVEAPLIFETKALVGTKKPQTVNAHVALADGMITVTADDDPEPPLYSVPYDRVMSVTYSRGRDPMWNSPQGPTPVARGGGTLGRLGIIVARDWISLRTSTKDQFVALRFEEVLVNRVLVALEERTGRAPELIREKGDEK